MFKSPRTLVFAAALLGVCGFAVAQQRSDDVPRGAAKPAPTANAAVDSFVIDCLKNKNQNEIAISKIAQQQSKNDSVKEFASTMVKEHTSFLSQLEQIQPTTSGRSATANGDAVSTLRQIANEVAQRSLASAKQELQKKEGREFDECFMGFQIACHMGMVDELTVLRHHTTGELKELLGKGLETTQDHLAHAKKVMKELAGKDSATASREKENSKQ